MKKNLIKFAVCVLVFFVTLFISVNVYNQRNTDMTTSMAEATLPLVTIELNDLSFNTLHGLKQEVDGVFARDTLTPLAEGRKLSFSIKKYGNDIQALSFEVRSIDGSRLVESTEVSSFTQTEDRVHATVTLKDLIEPSTEYNWILKVTTQAGEIRYSTRIMDVSDYYTYEKLKFVLDFHEKTFDKEEVKQLSGYIESNSKGDNTTLAYVDIHCNLDQLSWGELLLEQVTDTDVTISEIDERTASIRVSYTVREKGENTPHSYLVNEYYRIRYTTERVYLLDFEREMNQIFDPSNQVYASNKIMMGIRNDQVQMVESDGGSNVAFVNAGQLFCYHATDKKIAYIFSFYNDTLDDPRTLYANHDIKILNVDETGNVRFLVYGYMNRGTHEGEEGIQLYEYNGMMNHIEELIFIPYDKTFATLKADLENLSYLNKSQTLYLYLDGSIIAVNVPERSYTEVASLLQEGSFQVSDSNEMLVWQNSENVYDCTRLILMNLNTGTQTEISTSSENRMMPIGFMNEDLIYGVAHRDDIITGVTGLITFPMYALYIQNEQGKILKSYEQNGIYVTGSTITENLINLTRVIKDETGTGYLATTSDQIVNNIIQEDGYNTMEVVVTQKYEKIVQIVLKGEIASKSLKITKPKEILFEGSRDMEVELLDTISRYYVYGKKGILATFTHPADAIRMASEENGTVIDENGKYIWKKTARSTRNQIMKIKARQSDADTSAIAVCLETVMDYYGYSIGVQKLLQEGMKATQILSTQLHDSKVLELDGVSLDSVLYYVSLDIPVIANLDDDAVLVVGYNEVAVVIMDPRDGALKKIAMSDAKTYFEQQGNQFVTCIPYE